MSVALHGNLRDFGIGEVFQLIGQQQKTGILEVTGNGGRIRIVFDRGAVVRGEHVGPYEHAALGDQLVRSGLVPPERLLALERSVQDGEGDLLTLIAQRGELGAAQLQEACDLLTQNTMFQLLRWTQGSFHFTAQPVVGEGDATKRIPAEQILMDGLRMVDEWRTFDVDARELDTIWKRAEAFAVFRERAAGDSEARIARAEQLFALIDGRVAARRIVDLARMGEFDGVFWLSRLRRAGVIEPLARVAAPSRKRLAFAAGRSLASASSIAPFAALALAILGLVFARGSATDATSDASALARGGRIAMERALLRNAVEVYRLRHGEWPTDLQAALGDSPSSMAMPDPGAYYFAHRGDNFVVLLPEE